MYKVLLTSLLVLFTVTSTNSNVADNTIPESLVNANDINVTNDFEIISNLLPILPENKVQKCKSSTNHWLQWYYSDPPMTGGYCMGFCYGVICCEVKPRHPGPIQFENASR